MNMTCFRPSRRRPQVWVCVIAGLFVCDFIVCAYLPSQQRLASLKQAKIEQSRTIGLARQQGEELAGLKAKLRDTQRLVEQFEASVPSDNALGAFLQQVATLMSNQRLTDQVVLPGQETQAGDVGCIPIRMSCQGTLENLFGFFSGLQAMDRLVRIETVKIENDPGFSGQLTMQSDAYIFYQLKPARTENAGRADAAGGPSHGA
ncbi:MAG TPA: type 4a pilus biogenesis protein PilO [Sedimentisphaerales bacterium]|nr:type 4a pilus biogenesis protein PilO [Sedimentisphaerales bacterium]